LQVFLRGGVLTRLEEERDSRLSHKIVQLQACARGYLARRNLQKLKVAFKCPLSTVVKL
jgi:myosin heavy subunit